MDDAPRRNPRRHHNRHRQRTNRPRLLPHHPSPVSWPNRDPIGQEGGINLYSFAANDPTDAFDPLGLDISAPFREIQRCKDLQNAAYTSPNNQVKDALAEFIKGGAKKISYGPNDAWT